MFKRKPKIWTKVEEPIDVRVVIPYVKADNLLQTVVDSLRIQFVQPELHKIKPGDNDDYWDLLSGLWKEGEEFFIVEHDVIVWPGLINNMRICTEAWCTSPSLCHGRMIETTFGCVKFGKEIIEAKPTVWDDIAETKSGKLWFRLDASFCTQMGWPEPEDWMPHSHFPPITHMNEIQWPDSISKRNAYKKIAWQHVERMGEDPLYKVNDEVVELVEEKDPKFL